MMVEKIMCPKHHIWCCRIVKNMDNFCHTALNMITNPHIDFQWREVEIVDVWFAGILQVQFQFLLSL